MGEQSDPKLSEVVIVLYRDGEETVLTAKQSRAVIEQFETVRHEADKWRRKTGGRGRLLIIDPILIGEIEALLSSG